MASIHRIGKLHLNLQMTRRQPLLQLCRPFNQADALLQRFLPSRLQCLIGIGKAIEIMVANGDVPTLIHLRHGKGGAGNNTRSSITITRRDECTRESGLARAQRRIER